MSTPFKRRVGRPSLTPEEKAFRAAQRARVIAEAKEAGIPITSSRSSDRVLRSQPRQSVQQHQQMMSTAAAMQQNMTPTRPMQQPSTAAVTGGRYPQFQLNQIPTSPLAHRQIQGLSLQPQQQQQQHQQRLIAQPRSQIRPGFQLQQYQQQQQQQPATSAYGRPPPIVSPATAMYLHHQQQPAKPRTFSEYPARLREGATALIVPNVPFSGASVNAGQMLTNQTPARHSQRLAQHQQQSEESGATYTSSGRQVRSSLRNAITFKDTSDDSDSDSDSMSDLDDTNEEKDSSKHDPNFTKYAGAGNVSGRVTRHSGMTQQLQSQQLLNLQQKQNEQQLLHLQKLKSVDTKRQFAKTFHLRPSTDQLNALANSTDVLVPIRIDLELDNSHRLQDAFLWNIKDTTYTPEHFARILAEDLDLLDPTTISVLNGGGSSRVSQLTGTVINSNSANNLSQIVVEQVSRAIHAQVTEFKSTTDAINMTDDTHLLKYHLDNSKNSHNRAENDSKIVILDPNIHNAIPSTDGQKPIDKPLQPGSPLLQPTANKSAAVHSQQSHGHTVYPDVRVIIHIELLLGNTLVRDRFEWDLSSPDSYADDFARVFVAEAALPGEAAPLISHSIRDQIHRFRRQRFERSTGDPESSMLPDNSSVYQNAIDSGADAEQAKALASMGILGAGKSREARGAVTDGLFAMVRPIEETFAWGPSIEMLSKDDVDKIVQERMRSMRRVRRENTFYPQVAATSSAISSTPAPALPGTVTPSGSGGNATTIRRLKQGRLGTNTGTATPRQQQQQQQQQQQPGSLAVSVSLPAGGQAQQTSSTIIAHPTPLRSIADGSPGSLAVSVSLPAGGQAQQTSSTIIAHPTPLRSIADGSVRRSTSTTSAVGATAVPLASPFTRHTAPRQQLVAPPPASIASSMAAMQLSTTATASPVLQNGTTRRSVTPMSTTTVTSLQTTASIATKSTATDTNHPFVAATSTPSNGSSA
ncbi:hypothetical protein GQ42DRAFT_176487 [Ramicandelaber brevisporus]|nr:hypothetical protein GQ42DRAFT_176487 [Ramicandelaber brevisporus]